MSKRRVPPPFLRSQCSALSADEVIKGFKIVVQHFLGTRTVVCDFCEAIKWPHEWNSMCCMLGKVDLPHFPEPPPILKKYLMDEDEHALTFRKYIRQLNNALSMASLKMGSNDQNNGYNPTVFLQV